MVTSLDFQKNCTASVRVQLVFVILRQWVGKASQLPHGLPVERGSGWGKPLNCHVGCTWREAVGRGSLSIVTWVARGERQWVGEASQLQHVLHVELQCVGLVNCHLVTFIGCERMLFRGSYRREVFG
jgi:hypothetical protein